MTRPDRRQFLQCGLGLAGLGLLSGCGITIPGQQPARIPRIGYLAASSSPATNASSET